jgi:hypothetical protein
VIATAPAANHTIASSRFDVSTTASGQAEPNAGSPAYTAAHLNEEGNMRKLVLAGATGALIALAGAAPASAVCPAAPGGDPGRSEYAQSHITVLAHAGVLGHEHKPGTHRGASDCRALND